jgi:hypothetical protein
MELQNQMEADADLMLDIAHASAELERRLAPQRHFQGSFGSIALVFAAHAAKVTREICLLNLSPKVPRPDDGKFVVPRFQKNRSI